MRNPLSALQLQGGKRAAEHEDDEDEEAKVSKAQEDDDEDEDKEAKAQEEDEDEDEEEDEPESKEARRLAKAERKAERKLRLYARQVGDLCTLAGKPELAVEFIAKNVSTADVRKALLAQRASASSAAEIAGQHGPDHANAKRIDTRAIYDKFNHREARTNR